MLSRLLPTNLHVIDRGVRVLIGVAALTTTFVGPHSLWGLLGLVPLATALVGSCPLYTLVGVSSAKRAATQTGGADGRLAG